MRWAILIVLLALATSRVSAGFPEGKSALASGDFPAAFREFLAAANEGDVRAQLAAGLLYASGRETDRNYSEAVKWFRRAAEQNNSHGQFNLGVMYHTGRGLTQSAAEAAGWYRKAADLGLLQAQADLGAMYLAGAGMKYDYPEALKWLRQAAEREHTIAQANLACAYLMGGATRYSGEGIGLMGPRTGVTGTIYTRNEAEAAKWLRKAAVQGHVFSQFNMGFLFEKGLGVARDHSEAIAWYRRAVDAGLAQALMNLAVLYESGVDVARDPAAAMQLRMKSSRARIHRPQEYPILMVHWGAGIKLGEVNVDVGSQPAKDDLLMLFSPAFSIDPELDSSSSSTPASSPTQNK